MKNEKIPTPTPKVAPVQTRKKHGGARVKPKASVIAQPNPCDLTKLNARIILMGYKNRSDFAKKHNLNYQTINKKLAGEAMFTQLEILELAEILQIGIMDIPQYFFTRKTVEV